MGSHLLRQWHIPTGYLKYDTKVITCASTFGLLQQNSIGWGAHKWQKCLSHCLQKLGNPRSRHQQMWCCGKGTSFCVLNIKGQSGPLGSPLWGHKPHSRWRGLHFHWPARLPAAPLHPGLGISAEHFGTDTCVQTTDSTTAGKAHPLNHRCYLCFYEVSR